MDDNRLAKIAKNGKPNNLRPSSDRLPKIVAKIEYQHHRTSTLDKIQNMILRRRRR